MFSQSKKGFTLIELLVVIAIISLLSSVVLTSIQSSRIKGRDAAIKKSVLELRNFIELTRSTYDTYANIQAGPNRYWSNLDNTITPTAGKYNCAWLGPGAASSPPRLYTSLSATEGAEIQRICESIVLLSSRNKTTNSGAADYVLRIETATTTTNYSIMVKLASGAKYCLGSSGKSSITPSVNFFTSTPDVNANPGCRNNP